jgi:hypothetical protein
MPLGNDSGGSRVRLCARAVLLAVALVAALGTASGSSAQDGPTITYSIDGVIGTNGWYRGSKHGKFVVLHWTVSDPASQVISTSGCEAAVAIASPQTGTTRKCTAFGSGTSKWEATTDTIKVDAEPPTGVAARAGRAPDVNGWYNHPLAIGWHGADATSGIAGCTSLTFPSPGLDPSSLAGICTDAAGNSASASIALQYDSTPPALRAVTVESGDGDNIVRWRSSGPTDLAVVKRTARGSKGDRVVFQGGAASFTDTTIRSGVEYRYSVQTVDQAANASSVVSALALPKVVTLAQPAYVPRTAGAPVLAWTRMRRAAYYHVQLFRNGRRILAAWPLKTKLRLRARWAWNGHRYRLTPGTYGWYVWAGFGSRSAAKYKPLGRATFIVPRGG